jgi:hypothetical protein
MFTPCGASGPSASRGSFLVNGNGYAESVLSSGFEFSGSNPKL